MVIEDSLWSETNMFIKDSLWSETKMFIEDSPLTLAVSLIG